MGEVRTLRTCAYVRSRPNGAYAAYGRPGVPPFRGAPARTHVTPAARRAVTTSTRSAATSSSPSSGAGPARSGSGTGCRSTWCRDEPGRPRHARPPRARPAACRPRRGAGACGDRARGEGGARARDRSEHDRPQNRIREVRHPPRDPPQVVRRAERDRADRRARPMVHRRLEGAGAGQPEAPVRTGLAVERVLASRGAVAGDRGAPLEHILPDEISTLLASDASPGRRLAALLRR